MISSLRHHRMDQSGSAAVEFALLAPLVLALLFSVLEAGWIMTQSIMLDRGLSRASRAVQIGSTSMTYTQYKQKVCAESFILANCEKALRLELTPIDTASDFPATDTPCVDRSVAIDPVTTYQSGKASQLVFARACFVVDPMTPGIGYGLSVPKDNTGAMRLTSSFAFVNEPT
ncbi:pilus assembly protein [Rhizobium wenxiniae]|nr:pilus assembly protein [Rhizobium wenxiniae]